MKTVILGVTGSIAAYKAPDIVSKLIRKDCNIHAVLTKNGAGFITPLTLQTMTRNRVFVDTLQEDDPQEVIHVNLPAKADLLLIAPAMNTRMYENPATQHNLEILKQRGWTLIPPRTARLACGYEGLGALAEVDTIVQYVMEGLR